MPWLPYFDKIRKSEVFVFLDDIDYPKSGNSMGSWCNRVKINMHQNDLWFTCPVIRESGAQKINKVVIRNPTALFSQWELILMHAYKRTKNYDYVMHLLQSICKEGFEFLYQFNIAFIQAICKELDINRKFVLSSSLDIKQKSNALLANICKKIGTTTYLSGVGAKDYMDISTFDSQGINVQYQQYLEQNSSQFLKYSVIEYLFKTDKQLWKNF